MNEQLKDKVLNLPHKSGVYIMKDAFGQAIYIGKAKDLKKRVSQYFQKSRKLHSFKIPYMVDTVDDLEFFETKNEQQALILESRLIGEWKPRYNTDLKDNKNFLLLRVEYFRELPVFSLCRNRIDDNCAYFGPYPTAARIREVLALLKKNFGVISSDAKPQKDADGLYTLYNDARAEIYGENKKISAQEYMQRVDKAVEFLKGDSLELLDDFEDKMQKASENLKFEEAAKYRDLIWAVKETLKLNRMRNSAADLSRSPKKVAQEAIARLTECLGAKEPILTMECFDISHISGSFCVASMVRFENGLPCKAKYRHFKIKSFVGNDDFRAMNEVVKRRYLRVDTPPDLLVIDGGHGQLSATNKVFEEVQNRPKMIVGLAKREETIVLATDYSEIKLPKSDEALKLMQRIRDEAHRFANSFNAFLRAKKIRESVLDDFGMGEKRKIELLKKFGSISELKKATPQSIAEIKGISLNYAEKLLTFLNEQTNAHKS